MVVFLTDVFLSVYHELGTSFPKPVVHIEGWLPRNKLTSLEGAVVPVNDPSQKILKMRMHLKD